MEHEHTNPSVPELITKTPWSEEVRPQDSPAEQPEFIEIPEAIMPLEQRRQLGDVALSTESATASNEPVPLENGRFGRGVEPVENPGPQAFNQASANGTLPPNMTIRR